MIVFGPGNGSPSAINVVVVVVVVLSNPKKKHNNNNNNNVGSAWGAVIRFSKY